MKITDMNSIDIKDFNAVKNNIYMKLVNSERNQGMLDKIPSIPFSDLMITFYLCISEDEHGRTIAIINNDLLSEWNISVDDIYECAKLNTVIDIQPKIKLMSEVIAQMLTDEEEPLDEETLEMLYQPTMYVLSNESWLNGAICMTYDDILKKFSQQIGGDVYILPSSVHEVLLIPDSPTVNPDILKAMVVDVNRTQVNPKDFLSDSIYKYSISAGVTVVR